MMEIARIYLLIVPSALLALFSGMVLAMLIRDWRAAKRDGVLALGMVIGSASVMLAALWVVV